VISVLAFSVPSEGQTWTLTLSVSREVDVDDTEALFSTGDGLSTAPVAINRTMTSSGDPNLVDVELAFPAVETAVQLRGPFGTTNVACVRP
jgi:hypothetical protein